MTKKQRLSEYLRRNMLHAASIGAHANAVAAVKRLNAMKRQPAWLVDLLDGIIDRTSRVSFEMAAHRDELSPYKETL